MKALCVCSGGRVRSMALRWVLADKYGIDALACGVDKNTPETIDTLCEWADRIFVMREHFAARLNPRHASKVSVLDVGPDIWGTERHFELRELVHRKFVEWMESR